MWAQGVSSGERELRLEGVWMKSTGRDLTGSQEQREVKGSHQAATGAPFHGRCCWENPGGRRLPLCTPVAEWGLSQASQNREGSQHIRVRRSQGKMVKHLNIFSEASSFQVM